MIETSLFGIHLHVGVEDEQEGRTPILSTLESKNIDVRGIARIASSLEDVFLHLLERDAPGRPS